jgi:hypothetical protein
VAAIHGQRPNRGQGAPHPPNAGRGRGRRRLPEAFWRRGRCRCLRPVRTTNGDVLLEVDGAQVRAYEWVDLLPMDTGLDAAVGRGDSGRRSPHSLRRARPLHPWFTDPVGRDRGGRTPALSRSGRPHSPRRSPRMIPHLLRLDGADGRHRPDSRPVIGICGRTTSSDGLVRRCASSTGRTAASRIRRRRSRCSWSTSVAGRSARVAELYQGLPRRRRASPNPRTRIFTMVIAQFGHFWESAIDRYLSPASAADEKSRSLSRLAYSSTARSGRPHRRDARLGRRRPLIGCSKLIETPSPLDSR